MLSEIGSNFWISPNELSLQVLEITPEKFNCKGSDYVWMSTGRGATSFILDTIGNLRLGGTLKWQIELKLH